MAKIVQALYSIAQHKIVDLNFFLPEYLQTAPPTVEKSLEQQRAEAEAYHAKRHALLKV